MSLIVLVRKSRKVRMTPIQKGNLTVILMIAQNQYQMMMETRFDAFDDGLCLVISRKVSILLAYVL